MKTEKKDRKRKRKRERHTILYNITSITTSIGCFPRSIISPRKTTFEEGDATTSPLIIKI
jgi:hypothetical protein